MQHFISFPVLLPMLSAVILLLPPCGKNLVYRRIVSMFLATATLGVSLHLLSAVQKGEVLSYAIGNWMAPFGIVLVADITSAILVTLTSFLTLICLIYSSSGDDEKGGFFHPLIHFLMLGINGAFLTGDLFNLFVFFEVLLIASYALLMHDGDKHKTRAALHYVILNLVGSSVFLLALGTIYGVVGTLNMADLAQKVPQLSGDDIALAKIGGLLLMVVFGLKAAILPLHLWLPNTYASAMPVVSAMFAIMTKIGVYAMFRVYTLIFGERAGELAFMATDWLWPTAIVTIALGAIGVLASQDLKKLIANLVIVSVGTLVAAVAIQSVAATAAALYYLIHSTIICAAFFMLAELIADQRGKPGDRFIPGRAIAQPMLLGSAFVVSALAVVGMPPLSGFVGKLWLLEATFKSQAAPSFWPVYLVSSLVVLIALSRAGSRLFWRQTRPEPSEEQAAKNKLFAMILLLVCSPLMVIFAGPLTELTFAAAKQLHDVNGMIEAVLVKGAVQ